MIYNESGECVIVDPGNCNMREDTRLFDFIDDNNLKPLMILNTHAHIDHILGNYSTAKKYDIPLAAHPDGKEYYKTEEGVYDTHRNLQELPFRKLQAYKLQSEEEYNDIRYSFKISSLALKQCKTNGVLAYSFNISKASCVASLIWIEVGRFLSLANPN